MVAYAQRAEPRRPFSVYAPALSVLERGTVMKRLPISCLALAAVVGVGAACHQTGGDAANQPAKAPAAQAIVQPGAPGPGLNRRLKRPGVS